LRSGANDPQIQLAEDAARALDAGAQATSLVGVDRVDVVQSLAPFLVVFDASGKVLATDGQFDGHDPIPPSGVLASAQENPPDMVTWQPRSGVRIAAAACGSRLSLSRGTAAWSSLAARSSRSRSEKTMLS
jgi:hypothetical protein